MGDLTENFDRSEFACRCGCGKDDIDKYLVEELQLIRNAVGPLAISSGCRCKTYNRKIGGSQNSAHTRGKAADIECLSSGFRYKFLRQAFKLFRRIEVPNGTWIHVDVDESLPQDVCFTK